MIPTSLCILRILLAGMLQFLLTEEILTEPAKVPQRRENPAQGEETEVQCQQHNPGLFLLSPHTLCWLKPAETELSRAQDHILAFILLHHQPLSIHPAKPRKFLSVRSRRCGHLHKPRVKSRGKEREERARKGDEKCAPYQNSVPEQLWHRQAGQGRWQKAAGTGEGRAGAGRDHAGNDPALLHVLPILSPGSKFLKRARGKNPKRSIQKQNPKHSFWKHGRHMWGWKEIKT